MTATVYIDGAVGTTGLEIRERLEGRSDIRLVTLGEDQRKESPPGAKRSTTPMP